MPSNSKPSTDSKPVNRLVDFAPGAPDDFDCTWVRLRTVPWKYPNSKSGKYMCFLMIDIEPDPDSGFEPYTQSYTLGFLNRTQPSNDGENPTLDLDLAKELAEGLTALDPSEIEQYEGVTWCGSKPAPNLDWPELADSLQTCGWSYDEFPADGTFAGFEGLKCHMNRLPSKNQSQKKGTDGGDQKEWKVLKVTEIYSKPGEKSSKKTSNASAASKSGKSSSPSSSASSNNSNDLTSRVRDELVSAINGSLLNLNDNGGFSVRKNQNLLVKVAAKFNKEKLMKDAAKILEDDAFHEANQEAGLYMYDSDEGIVTPLEVE